MSAIAPRFWAGPIRYCRWASRERPALFFSCVIAAMCPVTFIVAPPLRRLAGDVNPAPVPMTYPIPSTPRKQLTGYDDDTEE